MELTFCKLSLCSIHTHHESHVHNQHLKQMHACTHWTYTRPSCNFCQMPKAQSPHKLWILNKQANHTEMLYYMNVQWAVQCSLLNGAHWTAPHRSFCFLLLLSFSSLFAHFKVKDVFFSCWKLTKPIIDNEAEKQCVKLNHI